MKAKEQIKKDLTEYCEKNNCSVEEAVDKLSSMLPDATKEEMGNLPEIVYAWQALQIQNQTHLQYHKSESLGEFIFNIDMFTLVRDHYMFNFEGVYLRYNPDFVGDIELPDGCINTSNMFNRCALPEGFSFGDKFDTSKVKDMQGMFFLCRLPEGFSLGDKFDTSNVENMKRMFSKCILPERFTLGDKFNASNVTNMQFMFAGSKLPKGFTLGDKFDTSNVIDMQLMFSECNLNEGFTLGDKFDTCNVIYTGKMFSECKLPKGFTLGYKFDISNVTDMFNMFSGCKLPDGTDAIHMDNIDVIEMLKK